MFNPEEVAAAARKAVKLMGKSGVAGYTEPGKVLLTGTTQSEPSIAQVDFALVAGEKYAVSFSIGGKTYSFEAVCKTASDDGMTIQYIGNVSLYGSGDDTGEAFLFIVAEDGGNLMCISAFAFEERVSFTLATAETIHPIDPKFIPGAVLPVVELSTVAQSNANTEITNADDIAKLNSLGDTPCILKLKVIMVDLDGVELPASVPMGCVYLDGTAMYNGVIVLNGVQQLLVTNDGEGWVIMTSGV